MSKVKLLMVRPNGYQVEYAINPHMLDQNGELKKVNRELAQVQWKALLDSYNNLGFHVDVIEGDYDYPDMVFAANQCFVLNQGHSSTAILSHMQSPNRQGEVAYFKEWAEEKGFEIYQTKTKPFEATGDLIHDPHKDIYWGGFGFRTHPEVYEELINKFKIKIEPLKLMNENFYHLDTCFVVLDTDRALYVEEAFDQAGMDQLRRAYSELIPLDYSEAIQSFSGNCFCPDGKNVFIEKTALSTIDLLREKKFEVHPVDTSEYIKAGGSVFCMKLQY